MTKQDSDKTKIYTNEHPSKAIDGENIVLAKAKSKINQDDASSKRLNKILDKLKRKHPKIFHKDDKFY